MTLAIRMCDAGHERREAPQRNSNDGHTKYPVIMLTAMAEVDDRVTGLMLKADDY